MMTEEQKQITDLDKRVSAIENKMDAFIQSNEDFKREMRETMKEFKTEMRENISDFKAEMRQQNEMRAREIADLRQETNQKVDQLSHDIKEVSNEVKGLGKEFRAMFIGFAAIIVALMISLFTK